MCMTTASLVAFLNLIALAPDTSTPGRIIVPAQAGPAHWVQTGDQWCTMAPQIDTQTRLTQARK